MMKSEIRCPEARKKAEIRNPRSEPRRAENTGVAAWSYQESFGTSSFGFLSDIGFRPSDFRP